MNEDLKHRFYISLDKSKLNIPMIHNFLCSADLAENMPLEVLAKSIENSLCFGLYEDEQQVGFARVITDYATSALLKDVFILEPYRRQGLGKWFVQYILEYPELQTVPKWFLGTKDAHGLYRRCGFKNLAAPEKMMMRLHSHTTQY